MTRYALVTGATSGIGRETAKGLANERFHVLLGCRDLDQANALAEDIRTTTQGEAEPIHVHLDSLDSVRRAAQVVNQRFDHLDVLVNNAGAIFAHKDMTTDGVERTFQVNHLGHFLLTNELMPLLEKAPTSRIINVSSEAHRSAHLDLTTIADPPNYRGMRAYSNAKLCNLLFTGALARRSDPERVFPMALHPGVVRTNWGRTGGLLLRAGIVVARPFMIGPAKGARTTMHAATAPLNGASRGAYLVRSKVHGPHPAALDPGSQDELWRLSERLIGDHRA